MNSGMIGKIDKAHRYAAERDRFEFEGLRAHDVARGTARRHGDGEALGELARHYIRVAGCKAATRNG
jgi:hypothetical protein